MFIDKMYRCIDTILFRIYTIVKYFLDKMINCGRYFATLAILCIFCAGNTEWPHVDLSLDKTVETIQSVFASQDVLKL